MLPRHRRRRLRPWPVLHLVPNMFTILGLCLGLTGLRYGLDQRFEAATAFIVLAAVVDGLDGRSARLLNLTSKLGAELDSLADFVNFGVIPALLVYMWSLDGYRGGWPVAMVFATCCALRLARFNSELDDPDKPKWAHHFFTGIPAPAAAGLALVPMMLWFVSGAALARSPYVNMAMLLFVAVMMVSRVPTFSLKRLRIRPDLVVPVLTAAGIFLIFLITETWLALSLAGVAYLACIPLSWLTARRMQRREAAAMPAHAETAAPPAAATPPPPRPPLPDQVVQLEIRPPRGG